jgi:hypothetical protein
MNDKILIGKKEKSDNGYVFTPYIKILELHLPIKFVRLDEKGQPIFIKINNN